MKKKRLVLLIVGAALVLAISGGLFALASGEGTETDPLVTKSYLEKVFQPQVEALIDTAVSEAAQAESGNLDSILADYKAQISARVDEFNASTGNELNNAAYVALLEEAVRNKLAAVEVTAGTEADVFRTVTLTAGQTLEVNEGAEFFLRTGSATAVSDLLNVPAGTMATTGEALGANTLYVAPGSGSGLTATADATVFIRGGCTVK